MIKEGRKNNTYKYIFTQKHIHSYTPKQNIICEASLQKGPDVAKKINFC